MNEMICIAHGRLMALGLGLLLLGNGCSLGGQRSRDEASRTAPTGRLVAPDRPLTPTGQLLTPAGRQIELPGMRPQALALSPDGRLLVSSGRNNRLVVMNPVSGQILQQVAMPAGRAEATNTASTAAEVTDVDAEDDDPADPKPDTKAVLSLTGLAFSPDGSRICLSADGGSVKVFAVDRHNQVRGLKAISLPEAGAPERQAEIPAGLAISRDGQRLYVAGNLGNKLYEIDLGTGAVSRTWDVGVAPFDVVLAANKAYVSNSGGRHPGPDDLTAPAGRGTIVRVDPVRHIASEGSVSLIDLDSGLVKTEVLTGLHASAMTVSPDGRYVVVANSGSDTLSVIDTASEQVVEQIWARQSPADLFGAQPNAVAFDRRGRRLYVCNGTQNAVAVIQFAPTDRASKLVGLIPVGWFPGAVVVDAAHKLVCVANIKGMSAAKVFKPEEKLKLRTKDFFGTISLVPEPSGRRKLAAMTAAALRNMRYPRLREAMLPARPGQPARPVPERVGEPSVFRHVVYVIKENRTYDQVLGDMTEGNGDPDLCTFGEQYTPNQHKLAREFVLLDNTYCSGVQSADGHQWTDSAIANEYIERQLSSDYPRSYSGGKDEDGVDALAWSSSGFIWDNALAHGKTFRNYGEWQISEAGWSDKARDGKPTWKDFWSDYVTGEGRTRLGSRAGIESLRPHSHLGTVGYDLRVPDVMRAAEFIKELRAFEAKGEFPHFVLLFLPNDHTGGTSAKYPTPGALVADNDLAFGQIVEAISRSRFWPETCVFAIEDDPQDGWDHVSGYRTTCFVASPYTRRRQTISTRYNQTSLVRTMELILGLPPMNQLDATATPMTNCFTDTPDFTPFTAVPSLVPLDQLNPEPKKVSDPLLRHDAVVSSHLPLDEVDRCPEDVLNRILWRAMKGPHIPYPEWAVHRLADED